MLLYVRPIALLACLVCAGGAVAVDFVRDVRPIFQQNCYACHGEEEKQSDLRLDIKSLAFAGGELYGASIVPGQPEASPLFQFVADEEADLQMPPDGPLTAEQIETLRRWIAEGASWPDGVDTATVEDPLDHWAFQPITHPTPPAVSNTAWSRNPIDRFVLARLCDSGLSPAPPASRRDWLRRVTTDLIGLPPRPAEVDAFLADQRPDAFARVVDRLLASPRYGERWAQHWLDVVRYADTHGFEVNTERPHAWPYRDYVIDAFNHDTPYDQFVREQLVGDALEADPATGFLVTASVLLPGQIGKDEASKRLARQDALDEIVVNIGQTFLGLTVGCARCHNHKFDPIAQRDYFAMQAFVAGVEYGDRVVQSDRGDATAARLRAELDALSDQLARFVPIAFGKEQRPAVNAFMNFDRFAPVAAKRVRFTVLATNRLEPCLDELEVINTDGVNVALATGGAHVSASGSKIHKGRHELPFVNDGRYGNGRSWMSSEVGGGWVEIELPAVQQITRIQWGRDRETQYADRLPIDYRIEVDDGSGRWQTVADASDRETYREEEPGEPIPLSALAESERANAQAKLNRYRKLIGDYAVRAVGGQPMFAGVFREPDTIHLLRRGDPEQPQEQLVPAVPQSLGSMQLEAEAPEQRRRAALAEWIADPSHPLTARVIANRIWQGHFGIGIVETANDLGRNGAVPSHPGLLDWLATELVRSGWSIKRLHRLIVLSQTYRQSTEPNPPQAAIDAGIRLLWRYPTRRLEGEAIRDAILTASGQLHMTMGGPGFDLFDKRGGLTGFKPVETFPPDGLRRMIYAHKVRRERDAVFGAFDCPDAGQSAPRRRESTTPIQALNLFNSPFVIEQASRMAERIEREAGSDVQAQIETAYRLTLCRPPTSEERAEAMPIVESHGLTVLCRALFNSNAFLFLP